MQDKHSISTERFILKFCGILLVILAFVLSISTYLSLVTNMAAKHQEIVMITIATYTFCKVTLAIINTIKIRKENALLLSAIRNIGCVDAAVSILSLQRSMLVSFEGMNKDEIYMMNAITGAGVFLFVLSLGIGMFLRSQKEYSKSERKGVKNMAKSKFVKANEKIAEKVTDGFQKVSNTVVDGYKKIEDKFVDQYLTKDGETVEEAKKRLRQEQEKNK